jgi:rubredoxin
MLDVTPTDKFQYHNYNQFIDTDNITRVVQHIVTHVASPVYTCDICSEVYESKSGFDKHQHSNGKKRKFMCGSCSFVGKNKSEILPLCDR